MATQELVVAGEESPFAILRMEASDVQDLITENIGTDALTPRDLDRVKIPSGGGQTWEIPTLEGVVPAKVLSGVIVHRATRRVYWSKSYDDTGGGEQPDCFSDDGNLGIGDPGGSCAECPYNEFTSGRDGISKACKEVRQLFLLPSDSLIPIVINLPPGSLANVKAYFLRLLRAQLSPLSVVTHLGLEKAESKGGKQYSRVVLSAGQRLDAEAQTLLRAYAANLQPAFAAASRVAQSEVDEV